MKSSSRSLGLPTSGSTTPSGPLGSTRAEHGAAVVGDQRHLGAAAGDVGDPPDQPVAVDHRVVDRDAGARPPVDRHRRVPDGRRAPDHPGGHGLVPRQGPAGGPARAACEAAGSRPRPLCALASLLAQVLDLRRAGRSFWPLAWKVSSNQLTRSRAGFSARVAPSSIGANTEATAALHRVKRAALALGELGREQHEADDDQSSTRTARRLRTCLRYILPGARPGRGGASCGSSGGSSRTPRATARSPPPRR